MEYDFSAGRSGLVSLVGSTNCLAIDMRVGGSALFEKSSRKILGWSFSFQLNLGSQIVFITKNDSKKILSLIRSMKSCSSEVALYLHKSATLPCMNTVVMSGLLLHRYVE